MRAQRSVQGPGHISIFYSVWEAAKSWRLQIGSWCKARRSCKQFEGKAWTLTWTWQMGEMVWKSRKQFYKNCKVRWTRVYNDLCGCELIGAFRGVGVMYQHPAQVLLFSKKIFLYGKSKGTGKVVCSLVLAWAVPDPSSNSQSLWIYLIILPK